MNSKWKKVNKHSGNIKRACKRKYQQIIANNFEIVCSNFNENRPDTTELENILVPPNTQDNKPDNNIIDVHNLESVDTSFDVVNDDTSTTDDDEENIPLLFGVY